MSQTLEELVVKLEAQNSQFIQQMTAAQVATQKSLDTMSRSVEDFTKTQKEVSGWSRAWDTMMGVIGGEAAMRAFDAAMNAGKALFNLLVVDGVHASNEEIEALGRLNQALASNGNYTDAAAESLEKWIKNLERTTRYQDTAIMSSAALLESMTGLKEKGLERATEAAMKLSTGLGVDLDTAVRLVGKSFNGQTDALSRYGISIAKTNSDAKNYENALLAIEGRFKTLSPSMETFVGAQNKISKGFEDIQKNTGSLITTNVAVVDTMSAFAKMLFKTADGMDDNKQALQEMIASGLVKAIEYTGYFMVSMDALDKAATLVWRTLAHTVVDSVGVIGGALNAFGVVSDDTMQKIADMSNGIGDIQGIESETTVFSTMAEKLAELGVAAEGGLAKVREGFEALPDPINAADEAAKRFTEAQAARAEEGKKMAEELITAQWEDNAIRDEILAQRLANEQQKIMDANATGLITEQQKNESLKALKNKYDEDERKRALAKQKFEADTQTAQIGAAGAVANALYTIGKGSSKELFLVTRAAAVAQAVVQAQLAAAQALASPPGPPYTAPLSAAVLVAGYANAAAMAATAIQGLQGGMTEVPGIGSADSYGPVALAPGERVVDSDANSDLKKAVAMILSGNTGGGGERIVVEIQLNDRAMEMIEAKLIERQRLNIASA